MQIHNDIEQGSDAWKLLRLGKFTASEFHILMGESQTRKTLLLKKAAERLSGQLADADNFSSIHTERGKEQEAEARELYEILSFSEVEQVGFITLNEQVGCSPDGLISHDGGVEIKCKDNHNHIYAVINNYVAPEHKTQCQFNMYVTGRQWWDYFLYNRNLQHGHIIKLQRDEVYIDKIKQALNKCEQEVQDIIQQFNKIRGIK